MTKRDILNAIKAKGLKQTFVADQIGVTDVYLCRILRRKKDLPKNMKDKLIEFLA